MHPPLPQYPATLHALYLQHLLLTKRCVDFDAQCSYSIDRFFESGGGIMFGVLVAQDKDGNEILLKAFSGSLGGKRNLPGWAKHLVKDQAYDSYMQMYDQRIKEQDDELMRIELSQKALCHYYSFYQLSTIDARQISLASCFPSANIPTGSGDCCTIKLLHAAFSQGLKPISMAEFFFGSSPNREHLAFYGPCDQKCKPILKQMLGLDIVYQDEHIVVVNKPSGLLSVPGRTQDKIDSVETRLRLLYPHAPVQCATHRLDMDTSGLLIVALNKQAHSRMHIQFRDQEVKKSYIALLQGVVKQKSGSITLPFRVDITNRPHQIYDEVHGKWGTTHYTRIGVERTAEGELVTRMLFEPQTGRTHQLRLHSSHPKGLGLPIVGDRLYGSGMTERLYLHAQRISFSHPISGQMMDFCTEIPF